MVSVIGFAAAAVAAVVLGAVLVACRGAVGVCVEASRGRRSFRTGPARCWQVHQWREVLVAPLLRWRRRSPRSR